ncbi:type II toxin-antitoxin system YhaV family toxin [Methylobacterium oryzihabitans]|uniref:Type II toxin-antitoxin system YhaV family toxin n=1 Tax=Methylobacterium oryzihabitans TaxID=2499852 RepID=A0A437NWP3_9HYPH|nr:type II toxin-antitoxin system YhaV family toxin [Methylobacterium oryzihabitans]RVU14433.1 type II toxin-antitoxin system YhaV family toxin [Methylobacterium oryzihabitans]
MSDDPPVINGWTIYAHPLFLNQLEGFVADVEKARSKDPEGFSRKRAAKLLAAVLRVAFEIIPEDPTRPEYRQGGTLGDGHAHWRRVKFLQQFRLFFRFRASGGSRVIVLAWVNDETTLRAYGRRSDAYAVFRGMLHKGDPPDDWSALVAAAASRSARARLGRSRAATPVPATPPEPGPPDGAD